MIPMEFGKALTYPFEDEEWLSKLGIGVAVSLIQGVIPYFGLAPLWGWQIKLINNVKNGVERPLPDWQNFGDYIMKGLLALVANLIYQIPFLLFVGVGLGAFFGLGGISANSDSGSALGVLAIVVLSCCGCLGLLYTLVATAAFWAGLIRYSDSGEFSTFMEFGTNFGMVFSNIGDWVVLMLILFVAGLIFVLASAITLGLGSLLVTMALTYVSGHLLGQVGMKLAAGGMNIEAALAV
jgi:hypothetical protein